MRLWQFGGLFLPVVLAGCGGDKPAATLSVTCGGDIVLAGARSIDVMGDPANGRAILSFPDPANPGTTGTLAVPGHERCSIAPIIGSGR